MSSFSSLLCSSRFQHSQLFLPPPPPPPPCANRRSSPPHLRLHVRYHPPGTWSGLLHVTIGGPPPPEADDPFGEDPTTGLEATFCRVQDGVQIFFSVLFWMSLFFWASAWDGRDNSGPRKQSRFRR